MTAEPKKLISKDETVEFLTAEYTECFNQMRHYEEVADSYLKFTFGGYPVIVGGISALYAILDVDYRNLVVSALLFLTFFAGFAVLNLLLTNRSYYVVVARQINAIRYYFLKNADRIDFLKYNKCYLDAGKPVAYNPTSTSTRLFDIISILNALVGAGFLHFLLLHYNVKSNIIWVCCGILVVALLIAQRIWGINYLKRKDREHEAQAKYTSINT